MNREAGEYKLTKLNQTLVVLRPGATYIAPHYEVRQPHLQATFPGHIHQSIHHRL